MLLAILVPPAISSYITNLYSNLSASVTTHQWTTPSFNISRGVFQGDTLSPLLFLLCFQPLITVANSLPSDGFRLKLPLIIINESINLPPVDSYIYVEWQEDDSSEPHGWYHCQVTQYNSDCHTTLLYRDGSTETLDLHSVQWKFARKNSKAYLPLNVSPPDYPLKKQREAAALKKFIWSEPHKIKAYADDLSFFSLLRQDHQEGLLTISQSCSDLGLEIRPDKCTSYCYDGHRSLPRTTFSLIEGNTTNISTAPTKFLGKTIGITHTQTKRLSAKKLSNKIYEVLRLIDARPIRGEYKVWIYKSYLIPSILFNLTVDRISLATSMKIQTKITSYLKKWLKLPRCATISALFHPEVLNLPYLPHQLEKCKLRYLASVSLSADHSIQSLTVLVKDPQFHQDEQLPSNSVTVFSSAKSLLKRKDLKSLYCQLQEKHIEVWSNHLESLSVQRKFLDLIPLEAKSKVWSRIITSLPAGQLSFLIRAGIDCLPTPATLSRWKYQCDTSCRLCHSSSCTTHHILNCCPVSLNQGRYTWRHDSILLCLTNILKSNVTPDTQIYADIPGHRASDTPSATIPLNILCTSARPDIVIIHKDTITLLELTVPINTTEGLNNARERKHAKDNYIHLLGDLNSKGYFADLETIEIGSLGHYST